MALNTFWQLFFFFFSETNSRLCQENRHECQENRLEHQENRENVHSELGFECGDSKIFGDEIIQYISGEILRYKLILN